jgi:poly-gamma-glutamate capsule biosynthesis protein CapA/YwtB (metallophosphatase superfamily)
VLRALAVTALIVAGLPAPGTAPARVRPEVVRLTIAASGDFLIHSPVFSRALANGGGRHYRFAPMFRPVRPRIAGADLALCHVETPLVPGPPAGYPIFRTPPRLARAIRATGWDACSTASNHSLDIGQPGIDSTIRALRRARVPFDGTARSPRGRRRFPILTARGVRVAFLAYTALTNGQPVPHRWSLNMARPRRILADARAARRRGADAVIVNLHWGDEFQHAVSPAQLGLARRLTRSPAVTAIVGQHAHVVQPIRRVNGKIVVFGEGNLISNQSAACCPAASQDGLIALLRLVVGERRAHVLRARYLPVWVRRPDYAVVPAPPESWRRTVSVVGRRPYLRPIPAVAAHQRGPAERQGRASLPHR